MGRNNKRLTAENYKSMAENRNGKWLGPEVKNTHTKTKWMCNKSHIWESNYNNIQQGNWCPVCANEIRCDQKRLSIVSYRNLANEYGFKWLGPEVRNTRTKTKWQCSNGHVWWTTYGNVYCGKGCPHCSGNAKKTSDDYFKLAKNRKIKWLGPEVRNTQTKTKWQCSNGHVWWTTYGNIKQGSGCPVCANDNRGDDKRTHPDVYHKLAKNKDGEWCGPEVKNAHTKTKWQCSNGHVWWTTYNHIQQGNWCPVCANDNRGDDKRTHPDVYHKLAKNKDGEWCGPEVKNNQTKTKWRCENGHEWWATYGNISRGKWCPFCNEPHGERIIRRALSSWNISFKSQQTFDKCRDKNPLHFDFYAHVRTPSGVTYFLIEYDGRQHFYPQPHFGGLAALRATQRRDRIKNEFAARHNIPLIRISYKQKHKIRRVLRDAIIQHTGVDPLTLPAPEEHNHAKPVEVVPEDYRQGRLWG